MAEIVIGDPSLVVLIGPAGAGKSTFAARHFDPAEVLSSDAFRGLVSGDESDQTATRAAFGRLHRELGHRLATGRLSVVDATNLERFARRALLRRAAAAGIPAVAIVFDLPSRVVIERNAGRAGRVVGEAIVQAHLDRMRVTLGRGTASLAAEGFRLVVVLRNPDDIEAVVIRREAGPRSG